ncbi:MAG: hypothetical protein AB7D01_06180, partial [Methanoculleus sp.]
MIPLIPVIVKAVDVGVAALNALVHLNATMAELATSFNFAYFVASDALDAPEYASMLQKNDIALYFYCLSSLPELITLAYYDQIQADALVLNYWRSHGYLDRCLQAVKAGREHNSTVDNVVAWLEAVLPFTPFKFLLPQISALTSSPGAVAAELAYHAWSTLNNSGHDLIAAMQRFIQEFDNKYPAEIPATDTDTAIATANPMVPFIVANLFPAIRSFSAAVEYHESPTRAPNILPIAANLPVTITLDNQVVGTTYPNLSGYITASIPRDLVDQAIVGRACLEVGGLKTCAIIKPGALLPQILPRLCLRSPTRTSCADTSWARISQQTTFHNSISRINWEDDTDMDFDDAHVEP